MPTPIRIGPPIRRAVSDVTLRAAVAALRAVIERLEAARGAPTPEPPLAASSVRVSDIGPRADTSRTTIIPNVEPSQGALDEPVPPALDTDQE